MTKTYKRADLRKWWQLYRACGGNLLELERRTGVARATWQHRIAACRRRLGVELDRSERARVRGAPVPREDLVAAVEAMRVHRSLTAAARALGISHGTLYTRLQIAERELGLRASETAPDAARETILRLLRRPGGATLAELASGARLDEREVRERLERLRAEHFNLAGDGERWMLHAAPASGIESGRRVEHESDADGWYQFGLVADSHIGSKYARLDVLNDIYDTFARAGVRIVYHCGNMIDGFRRGINDHDVLAAGMDDQIALLVRDYPRRPGIVTRAVSGDDHEGWYAGALGIDIGRRIEQSMREAGRTDWEDLGYMECYVTMRHAASGAAAQLLVAHPGGGSSYADSYVAQKIVESFEGGEKPGIYAAGHYHKCLVGEYRNVWYCLVPCTQDQTPWARKKRLRYVIGAQIVECWQRAETGAIERFRVETLRYFNRGYYNDRWRKAGEVVLPARAP